MQCQLQSEPVSSQRGWQWRWIPHRRYRGSGRPSRRVLKVENLPAEDRRWLPPRTGHSARCSPSQRASGAGVAAGHVQRSSCDDIRDADTHTACASTSTIDDTLWSAFFVVPLKHSRYQRHCHLHHSPTVRMQAFQVDSAHEFASSNKNSHHQFTLHSNTIHAIFETQNIHGNFESWN